MDSSSERCNPSPAGLRLLVLGSAELAAPPRWPAALAGAAVVLATDAFAAATALATEPAFHALVVDGSAVPRRTVEILALVQRHRPLAVWLAEPVRPALRTALAAVGAVPLSTALQMPWPEPAARPAFAGAATDGQLSVGPALVAEQTLPLDVEDVPDGWPVDDSVRINGRLVALGEDEATDLPDEDDAGMLGDVSPEPAERYDAVVEQPMLTADELKALLGA